MWRTDRQTEPKTKGIQIILIGILIKVYKYISALSSIPITIPMEIVTV